MRVQSSGTHFLFLVRQNADNLEAISGEVSALEKFLADLLAFYETIYRYTSQGEGVFSAGKRMLPGELVDEAWKNRKWLPKPDLPGGNYRFWLTKKGKEKYEATLLNTHKKYLADLQLTEKPITELGEIAYDEWQVVEQQ